MTHRYFLAAAALAAFGLAAAVHPACAAAPAVSQSTFQRADTRYVKDLWALKDAPRWQFVREIHVAPGQANASDTNPGTAAAPFKTLGEAIRHITPGTRVLLHPGIYPETVELSAAQSGTRFHPVSIEAVTPGTAILTGSDTWSGWQPDGPKGDLVHSWSYKWGAELMGTNIKPLGRRAEMVFVNGELYRQVLTRAEMTAKTYAVSEDDGKLWVRLAPGLTAKNAKIDVSVRPAGIRMQSVWGSLAEHKDYPSYFILRGLRLEHYNMEAALAGHGFHFLIDNCQLNWNNANGLNLRGRDIVVRKCRINHNGYAGFVVPPTPIPAMENVLVEDSESSHCNWRGDMGGLRGDDVAGTKLMTSRNVLMRRFTANDNPAPGIWFDQSNRNITFDGCHFLRNDGAGIMVEIAQGPVDIIRTVCAFNGSGVSLCNSSFVTLDSCVLYGNRSGQIDEWSPDLAREGFFDYGLQIRDCIIQASTNKQSLWHRPNYTPMLDTIDSHRNVWYRPGGGGWTLHDEDLDFAGWVLRTKSDFDSIYADARLKDPEHGDFGLRPGSPAAKHDWGNRAVVDVTPNPALVRNTMHAYDRTFVYMYEPSGRPIHYTTDGSTPTLASPVYTTPFPALRAMTLHAKAFGERPQWDPITTAQFIGGSSPYPDVMLDTLTPTKNVVGYGDFAKKNTAIMGASIHVAGLRFANGMGVHAASELDYDLKPEYKRFVSAVGVDDEVLGQANGKSSVTFEVYVDNALLAKTGIMKVGQIQFLDVPLPAKSKQLRLVVTDGGDGNDWDHADWAQAGFMTDAPQ